MSSQVERVPLLHLVWALVGFFASTMTCLGMRILSDLPDKVRAYGVRQGVELSITAAVLFALPPLVIAFKKINNELELYSLDLIKKYMAVAAAKVDAAVPEQLAKLRDHCRTKGYEFFPISSVTGEGLDQLLRFLADKVEEGRRLREAEGKGRETVIEGG